MKKIAKAENILHEFNKLIFSDVKETVLEEFLRVHYQVYQVYLLLL